MPKLDPDRLTNKQLAILIVLLEASTEYASSLLQRKTKYMAALEAIRKVRNQPAEGSFGAKS